MTRTPTAAPLVLTVLPDLHLVLLPESELATLWMATRNHPSVSDVRRIEGVFIAHMSLCDKDQLISPVRTIQISPEEEDTTWQCANHQRNPGADDPDEGQEVDIGHATIDAKIDRGPTITMMTCVTAGSMFGRFRGWLHRLAPKWNCQWQRIWSSPQLLLANLKSLSM